jgi:hypothetical protein
MCKAQLQTHNFSSYQVKMLSAARQQSRLVRPLPMRPLISSATALPDSTSDVQSYECWTDAKVIRHLQEVSPQMYVSTCSHLWNAATCHKYDLIWPTGGAPEEPHHRSFYRQTYSQVHTWAIPWSLPKGRKVLTSSWCCKLTRPAHSAHGLQPPFPEPPVVMLSLLTENGHITSNKQPRLSCCQACTVTQFKQLLIRVVRKNVVGIVVEISSVEIPQC